MQFIHGYLKKTNRGVTATITLVVPAGVSVIGLEWGQYRVTGEINQDQPIRQDTNLFQITLQLDRSIFNEQILDLSWNDQVMPLIIAPTSSDSRRILLPVEARSSAPIAEVAAAVNDNTAAINDGGYRIAAAVNNTSEAIMDGGQGIADLSSFPILNIPLNLGNTGGGTASSGSGLRQQAAMAIQQVLGWKPRDKEPAAFMGALSQSFELSMVEGHVVSRWTPRTYTVQTDFAGGISGAQASLYERAVKSIEEAKKLLSGLKPLRVVADPEDREALTGLISDQLDELVSELGMVTGPRVPRVDANFERLLGIESVTTDPDVVLGMLGDLRKELGFQMSVSISISLTPADDYRAQQRVVEQIVKFPNVYADTSGMRMFEYLQDGVRRAGAVKVLFGTDGPWLHPAVEIAKVHALRLPAADQAKILGGNLIRLLRKRMLRRTEVVQCPIPALA